MGTYTWETALSRSRKYSSLSAPLSFEGSAARLMVFDVVARPGSGTFRLRKIDVTCFREIRLLGLRPYHQFISSYMYAIQSYIMASSNTAFRCVAGLRQCGRCSNVFRLTPPAARSFHYGSRIPTITASSSRLRPKLQSFIHQPNTFSQPTPVTSRRMIFIQTENTPNADVRDTEHLFVI